VVIVMPSIFTLANLFFGIWSIVLASRPLGAGARLRLARRLLAWTRDLVSGLLAPLLGASAADLSAAARGLIYQLQQGLGTIPALEAAPQLQSLTSDDRTALRRIGVRVGRHVVFVPALLSADAIAARVALANAHIAPGRAPARLIDLPRPGTASLRVDPDLPAPSYAAIGYPAFGARAIRADLADGIAARLRGGARPPDIASRLGCRVAEIASVRKALLSELH